jgi:hypothetical protein
MASQGWYLLEGEDSSLCPKLVVECVLNDYTLADIDLLKLWV